LGSYLNNIWQALQDVVSSKENIWKSCPSASACSGKMLELARDGGSWVWWGQIGPPRATEPPVRQVSPTPGCRDTYKAISNCSSHFFFSSRVLKKSS